MTTIDLRDDDATEVIDVPTVLADRGWAPSAAGWLARFAVIFAVVEDW